ETGRYRPVGSLEARTFSGRVIAATCVDLAKHVAQARFRADLYYRLNVLQIRVPSLEERIDDIPALVSHFMRRQPRSLGFTEDAIASVQGRSWPGNVRELRNLIDRLVVLAPDGPITAERVASVFDSVKGGSTSSLSLLVRALLQNVEGDKFRYMENALLHEA